MSLSSCDEMMPEQEPSIELVEAQFRDRSLLGALRSRYCAPDDLLTLHCVALHNDGRIDLTEMIDWQEFLALSNFEFFTVQTFFVEAVPRITGSV
jgi:hypothetical protein